MTYAVDYSDDYLYCDGIETISITPRATGVEQTGVKAIRDTLSVERINTGAFFGFSPNSLSFVCWTATMGGINPIPGDTIEDADGVQYIVLFTRLIADLGQYELVANKAQT